MRNFLNSDNINAMKKKKNVIARVGNFEVVKDSGREHDYVRIRAVNGH